MGSHLQGGCDGQTVPNLCVFTFNEGLAWWLVSTHPSWLLSIVYPSPVSLSFPNVPAAYYEVWEIPVFWIIVQCLASLCRSFENVAYFLTLSCGLVGSLQGA